MCGRMYGGIKNKTAELFSDNLIEKEMWMCTETGLKSRFLSLALWTLRPNKNNPNLLPIGETFGFSLFFDYPNFKVVPHRFLSVVHDKLLDDTGCKGA